MIDSRIIAALITAISTILAAFVAVIVNKSKDNNDDKKKYRWIFHLSVIFIGSLIGFIVYLIMDTVPKQFPIKNGLVADFNNVGPGGPPRNAFFESFSVILDSEYNGNSKCWYKLEWEGGSSDRNGFLRLFFQLEPFQIHNTVSFVGLFTDFSYPPPKSFDVSKFSSISLKVRINKLISEETGVYVAIAYSSIPPMPGVYDFPEYRIPHSNIKEDWERIDIPLSRFLPPGFSPRKSEIKLDLTSVFRIIIALKSSNRIPIKGYIDIDDIMFE